ncbi:Hypothetical predicted protein [Mytilus galloprovincialis]|uniref:Uncharacterized protein n=1 Tax=Mytilus galloprovincialis TaxID=29158 RepID=A0A8B6HIQ5_MYTGA|nr:Hypothetical predicted protein [Mytilus galloprovincialis]
MKKALTMVNHDRLKLCRDRELPAWINRAIVEFQNGGVAQAMQINNHVTPSQASVQGPVGVDPMLPTLQSTEGGKTNASTDSTGALYCTCRGPYTGEFMISCDKCSKGALEMSSDESTGGSPKRSWPAEEKREEKREVSPRGRHQDRVPSVEGNTQSLRDRKGQEGEAEVTGEAISGDNRYPSPKVWDMSLEWGSGVVRSTRDGSPNARERARSGSREGTARDPSGGRSRCSVIRSTPGAAVPMARDTRVSIPADRDAHSVSPLGRAFKRRRRPPRIGREGGIGRKNALQRNR